MKSSRSILFLGAALALCASTATYATDRMRDFGESVSAAFYKVRAFVSGLFDMAVAAVIARTAPSAPPVLLVKAKQYTARLLRRETPRIENTWRMCPSV